MKKPTIKALPWLDSGIWILRSLRAQFTLLFLTRVGLSSIMEPNFMLSKQAGPHVNPNYQHAISHLQNLDCMHQNKYRTEISTSNFPPIQHGDHNCDNCEHCDILWWHHTPIPVVTYSYFVGFINDGTGSYQYTFMSAGSILLLAAASLIVIPFTEAIKRRNADK